MMERLSERWQMIVLCLENEVDMKFADEANIIQELYIIKTQMLYFPEFRMDGYVSKILPTKLLLLLIST